MAEYLPILILVILWIDVWVNALGPAITEARLMKSSKFALWYTAVIVIAYTVQLFFINP